MFLESLAPYLPTHTIWSHFWLHQDHQEAPKSGYLVKIDSLDELFHINMQGILCFWNPWHHTYLLIPFGVILDSIRSTRKLRKLQNWDIWWILIVLVDFFILICKVLYVFGILGTIPTYSYQLRTLLTQSGPLGRSGISQIWTLGQNTIFFLSWIPFLETNLKSLLIWLLLWTNNLFDFFVSSLEVANADNRTDQTIPIKVSNPWSPMHLHYF